MSLRKSKQSRRDAAQMIDFATRNGDQYAVQFTLDKKIMGPGTTHQSLADAKIARDTLFKRVNADVGGEVHARPRDFMSLEVFIAELLNGESRRIDGTVLHGHYDSAKVLWRANE